jgi:hypothetical protein
MPANQNDYEFTDNDFLILICVLPDGELEVDVSPLALGKCPDYLLGRLNKARQAIVEALKKT